MKLLFIMMAALLMPIVPALACFPSDTQTEEVLFQSEDQDQSFSDEPLPMRYCESGENGFVIVNGKCYDQDAITDFETEEECQADAVCKAYREQQKKAEEPGPGCLTSFGPPEQGYCHPSPELEPLPPSPMPGPILDSFEDLNMKNPDRTDDPNHGEIKGDEELTEDEEEHQEEEKQGEEEQKETTEGGSD
jgi:hypothetical protein